jgi:hypothetical protein
MRWTISPMRTGASKPPRAMPGAGRLVRMAVARSRFGQLRGAREITRRNSAEP